MLPYAFHFSAHELPLPVHHGPQVWKVVEDGGEQSIWLDVGLRKRLHYPKPVWSDEATHVGRDKTGMERR
eukprot:12480746-Prorocentrum_lima.AAC.1